MAIQITAKFRRSADFRINVDLDLNGNEIAALFGKSGSGKSSILRFVAGFEKFPNNFLSVNGTILQDKSSFVQPEHRKIGYVFQSLLAPRYPSPAAGNVQSRRRDVILIPF